METIDVPNEAKKRTPNYAAFSMSKTDFLDWTPNDGFVYEWSQGVLEPTHGMKQDELGIIRTMEDCFYLPTAFTNRSCLFPKIACRVTVTICTDSDLINAAPVLPDMTMTVNDMFTI